MIRGKKNWLPPVQLLYGFALLFRIEEGSLARHLNERRPWARGQGDQRLPEPLVESSVQELGMADDASTSSGDSEDDGHPPKIVEQEENVQDQSVELEDEVKEESEEESSDEEMEFPDTQIESLQPTQSTQDLPEPVESTEQVKNESKEDGSKHLSAKQRRDLKKGKPVSLQTPHATQTTQKSQQPSQPSNLPTQVRGKKGKLKKLKSKYADQSDEERELAMQFLGSTSQKSKPESQPKAQPAKTPGQVNAQKQLAAKAEKLKVQETEIDLDEEDESLVTGMASEMAIIDALSGVPHESDDIVYAIPVCAPWSALQRYKYKVKLMPVRLFFE
jgi:hypothetical protein